MAIQQPSQRRFAVMGTNTFNIANKLMQNQRLCRLLKYQVRDPFNEKYEDVDGIDLLNKQIMIVPKIFDDSTEKTEESDSGDGGDGGDGGNGGTGGDGSDNSGTDEQGGDNTGIDMNVPKSEDETEGN